MSSQHDNVPQLPFLRGLQQQPVNRARQYPQSWQPSLGILWGPELRDPGFLFSLPCISFLEVCEVSSEWQGRITWAFPSSVQRACTDKACRIRTASLHCNICWFQDWITGHLIPIKYLKQLLCEFARCPQTRLVCFQWADTEHSRVLWISSVNIKAVTMEMAYSQCVWSTLSRFEG